MGQQQRYRSCVDLHLIVRNGAGHVLLGERRNTGWADGQLGLPSGHLEDGEPVTAGAVREGEEEIGIVIKPEKLVLVHLMHHHTDSGRVALFFQATTWSGEIVNREPDKCAGWDFVPRDALPANVVPYVGEALAHYSVGVAFSERGWG